MNALVDIQYVNAVHLPEIYKDENNELRWFKDIESPLKLHIEKILQCITPDAEIKGTPTLKSYECLRNKFSILNFTDVDLKFITHMRRIRNEEKEMAVLFAGNDAITSFTPDDCRIVAYRTSQVPLFICVEQKDDQDDRPGQRFYITKDEEKYTYRNADRMGRSCLDSLYSQIPFQIADVANFISTDSCMKELVQRVHKKALLKETPFLTQFLSLKNKPRFTVLNHTNYPIIFDMSRNLFINNHEMTKFTKDDCQLIGYHMPDKNGIVRKDVICLEQQDEGKKEIDPRIFVKLTWLPATEKNCLKIFEDVHKNWAVKRLLVATKDEKSEFSKAAVPADIINYIALLYFDVLNLKPKDETLESKNMDDSYSEDDFGLEGVYVRMIQHYPLEVGFDDEDDALGLANKFKIIGR